MRRIPYSAACAETVPDSGDGSGLAIPEASKMNNLRETEFGPHPGAMVFTGTSVCVQKRTQLHSILLVRKLSTSPNRIPLYRSQNKTAHARPFLTP